uniref:Uncharacterized protein n=1 Tax=Glossina pallidipes TaxID=7398 RepID=A0A1B0A207_GLOPL
MKGLGSFSGVSDLQNNKVSKNMKTGVALNRSLGSKLSSTTEEISGMIKNEAPLILKPKNKQNSDSDLNKNVDPKSLKISNVHSKNDGLVMIDRCGDNKREKF